MFKATNIIRPNIIAMEPYSSARDEFYGTEGVMLDANENPYGELNRYPDPHSRELKKVLAKVNKVSVENIFLGNGSDEALDLLFRICCRPGKDKAMVFSPTYSMYGILAKLNDVGVINVPLNNKFEVDISAISEVLKKENPKLTILCSPNNPTGNSIPIKQVEWLLKTINGLVVLDEAYIEFSNRKSWVEKIEKYPNLIVLKTLSKAWGLAGARIGMALASVQLIGYLNKIKLPYNVSSINQQKALAVLKNPKNLLQRRKQILFEKQKLLLALEKIKVVTKVFPSGANFFLVETTDANSAYQHLVGSGIIVRNVSNKIRNCLRISVGTPTENSLLLKTLNKIKT